MKNKSKDNYVTLDKAIEFGEYHPDALSRFEEWKSLSRIMQFELIRKAIENRHRHLITQYAEINNALDFSKKPYLTEALHNIEKQLQLLAIEKEKLYVDYSL